MSSNDFSMTILKTVGSRRNKERRDARCVPKCSHQVPVTKYDFSKFPASEPAQLSFGGSVNTFCASRVSNPVPLPGIRYYLRGAPPSASAGVVAVLIPARARHGVCRRWRVSSVLSDLCVPPPHGHCRRLSRLVPATPMPRLLSPRTIT